jgi:hypothetical protein
MQDNKKPQKNNNAPKPEGKEKQYRPRTAANPKPAEVIEEVKDVKEQKRQRRPKQPQAEEQQMDKP